MNFALLKEIIVKLKSKIRCPKCRRRFANHQIKIVSANDQNLNAHLNCNACKTQVIADVSLAHNHDLEQQGGPIPRQHQGIKVRANAQPAVNANDVLDIKNFLKDFEGSFKNLFTKQNGGSKGK